MNVQWSTEGAPATAFPLDELPAVALDSEALTESLSDSAPTDGLSIMLMLMERSQQGSLENAQLRISNTRDALKAELKKFLEQVAEALRAAEKAKEDDGGFFSDLVGCVTDIVNKILGPVIEANIEVMTLQVDLCADIANSIATGQNLLDNVKQTTMALTEKGQISADVSGFTEGTAKFLTDATEFLVSVQVAAVRAAATGEDVGDLVAPDAKKLVDSLERNILENPGFWAVVNATATAAAAVATCGTAAPAAVAVGLALMAALEVDKRTGLIEKAVGKDAAPWVRLGMQVAATVCFSVGAGGSGDLATKIAAKVELGTKLLNAGHTAYLAVEAYAQADEEADAIDREADQLQTIHNMQRMQRLLEQLLGSLEEDAENQTKTRELGAEIVQTQGKAEAAVVIPA